jgi:HSP90 family molecular chaperone
MQRYMQAQAVASGTVIGDFDNMNKVCMQINPNHPIVKDLDRMIKADKKGTEDFALLLFDVAGKTSGYDIKDMSSSANRVMGLISEQAGDKVPEAEVVQEEEEDVQQQALEVEVIE